MRRSDSRSGAYPAGMPPPIRSYFNIVPAMSSLATEAQAQLTGWLALRSQTAPTINLPDGGYLYTEGGALKYLGSSGTITVLAPA